MRWSTLGIATGRSPPAGQRRDAEQRDEQNGRHKTGHRSHSREWKTRPQTFGRIVAQAKLAVNRARPETEGWNKETPNARVVVLAVALIAPPVLSTFSLQPAAFSDAASTAIEKPMTNNDRGNRIGDRAEETRARGSCWLFVQAAGRSGLFSVARLRRKLKKRLLD